MRSLLLVLLAATACEWTDDRPIAWERERQLLGPIQLKDKVAYVDSALDRVTLVDLASGEPELRTARIGRNALHAMPSSDRHALFVITRGEEAIVHGQIDQPPLLWSLDTESRAEPVAYSIGSPFDRLAIAPDNRTAIAYFSAAGPDSAGFFRNPNEIAVVDLTRPPGDDNPTLKTIRSFGSVPEGVTLSPPMTIPGTTEARTFAYILSENQVTVLDVAHPTRREISIRLDLGGAPVIPREVVFAKTTASAYVRSDNARDVLQILLEPVPPATPESNDFRPVLAELGAGGGPTDIAVYDDANGERYILAATPNTGEVVVIHADTAQFRSVPLAEPIDRILLFPTSDPDRPEPPHKALFRGDRCAPASCARARSRAHHRSVDPGEHPAHPAGSAGA